MFTEETKLFSRFVNVRTRKEINRRDGEGDTILHYCVKECDDIEFIKLMVEYGGEIGIKSGENLCALCLAEKVGKVEIRDYFSKILKLMGEQSCELNYIK